MIDVSVRRTKIFKESTEEFNLKWFDRIQKKYIHHIDNIYYSCYLTNDIPNSTDSGIMMFIESLQAFKDYSTKKMDSIWIDKENGILFKFGSYSIYNYRISVNGLCDIFVAKTLPNSSTPRIVVQLRSEGLWSIGELRAIERSYEILLSLLNEFNISVERCMENRIDYAYHTNCIQNPLKFYSDKILINNLISPFKNGAKYFDRSNGKIDIKTLSLGNRKSNNLFFRSYDKCQEILDKSHKYYFYDIWLQENLINKYDYYVYTYCATHNKKADAIEWGMAEFYVQYGTDLFLIKKLKSLLNNVNTNVTQIREVVNNVLPRPTLIFNIEFQTMRKFYTSGDSLIDTFAFRSDVKYDNLVRLFQILDNRFIFLDYLTSKSVAFVKDNKDKVLKKVYMDFWGRLRGCKVDKINNTEFIRTYNEKSFNREISLRKIKSEISKISIYDSNFNTDYLEDLGLALNYLNDNSMKEIEKGVFGIENYDYIKIKEKNKKALKSINLNANQVLL